MKVSGRLDSAALHALGAVVVAYNPASNDTDVTPDISLKDYDATVSALAAEAASKQKDENDVKGDAAVSAFLARHPADSDAWVDATAVVLPGVRQVLKLLLRVVLVLMREHQ